MLINCIYITRLIIIDFVIIFLSVINHLYLLIDPVLPCDVITENHRLGNF
jgi:hypothetical protein